MTSGRDASGQHTSKEIRDELKDELRREVEEPGSEEAEKLRIRSEWISACSFLPMTESEIFKEISERIRSALAAKERPVVLLDLDSTLYEVGPRSFGILQEWLSHADSAPYPVIRERLSRLREEDIGYSLKDTFRTLGLSLEDQQNFHAWESAKQFWMNRFFTSEYLKKFDRPYPGAARFTQEIHRLGAEVVYLTGRDEPGMGAGTRECLLRDGFPWDQERTHLLLKAAFDRSDLGHKTSAARFIRDLGRLVASFENEPANLVALYDLFPDAMHVFVETLASDRGARPIAGLYRVRHFE
ncbi:MAG TPA: HAD family hydrolase [Bdellovibrionota bacterium]|nr:HAD family hydrolase [Bdellovibrionota bacterium]